MGRWHGFVHRSPTVLFALMLGTVGLFDAIGVEELRAFLEFVFGQDAAAKILICVGVGIPALRFLATSSLLARWRDSGEQSGDGP